MLFISGIAIGQSVPQAFNYQGIAIDANGSALASTTIGLRFSLLENSPSGNIAYQETQTTTTTTIGQFSSNVGFGSTQLGSFTGLNWKDINYYLQVEMDENGGTNYSFSGIVELLSVPYALFVETSDNTPMGRLGVQGAQGAQGPRGAQGPQGPPGIQGANAGQGPTGEQGDAGPAGPVGPAGPAGPNGGTQGNPGPIGPQGPPGTADGPPGPTGPQGPVGPQGAIGPEGPAGPQGPAGTEVGPQGIPGAPSNEVGPQGPDGPQGPGGGPVGIQGPQGISCWDLNGNGVQDAGEDSNGDGLFNAADCNGSAGMSGVQGPQGPAGLPGGVGNMGDSPAYVMTNIEPSSPPTNSLYLDDGTNRQDNSPGFRFWDGSAWTDL